MLLFSLNLTDNQIRILRAYAHTENPRIVRDATGRVVSFDQPDTQQIRHFVTGVRGLVNDGLLRFHNPGFSITAKGKLVLQIVEMDLRKFLDDIGPGPQPQPAPASKVDGRRKPVRLPVGAN